MADHDQGSELKLYLSKSGWHPFNFDGDKDDSRTELSVTVPFENGLNFDYPDSDLVLFQMKQRRRRTNVNYAELKFEDNELPHDSKRCTRSWI